MKILLRLSALLIAINTAHTWAQTPDDSHQHGHAHHHESHENMPDTKQINGIENTACDNIVDVKVNGLVCDFCARALEKVFGKRDEVNGIDVDLNNAKVSIAMKETQTIDDATLTKLITDSGYDVVSIARDCPS